MCLVLHNLFLQTYTFISKALSAMPVRYALITFQGGQSIGSLIDYDPGLTKNTLKERKQMRKT